MGQTAKSVLLFPSTVNAPFLKSEKSRKLKYCNCLKTYLSYESNDENISGEKLGGGPQHIRNRISTTNPLSP